MGVRGGTALIRSADADLRKCKTAPESELPRIRTAFDSVGNCLQSLGGAVGGNPPVPLCVCVDTIAHFYHLKYRIAGECAIWAFYKSAATDFLAVARERFKFRFSQELANLHITLTGQLKEGEVLAYMFDNASVVAESKEQEFMHRRRPLSAIETKFHDAVLKWRSVPRAASANRKRRQKKKQRGGARLGAGARSRTIQDAKATIRRTAHAVVSFGISSADFGQNSFLGIAGLEGVVENAVAPGEHDANSINTVLSWEMANPRLATPANPVAILAADEADFTILRFAAQQARTTNRRVVVLSPDSDFSFIPSYSDVYATIAYAKWRPTRFRKERASKPWIVTNNSSFQSFQFPWKTPVERALAALLAGHDYLPGGLPGLGLHRIKQTDLLSDIVGVSELLVRIQERAAVGGSLWTKLRDAVAPLNPTASSADMGARLRRGLIACIRYNHARHSPVEEVLARVNAEPSVEASVPNTPMRAKIIPRFCAKRKDDMAELPRRIGRFADMDDAGKAVEKRVDGAASHWKARMSSKPYNSNIPASLGSHPAMSTTHLDHRERPRHLIAGPKEIALLDPVVDARPTAEQPHPTDDRHTWMGALGAHNRTGAAIAATKRRQAFSARLGDRQAASAAAIPGTTSESRDDQEPDEEDDEEAARKGKVSVAHVYRAVTRKWRASSCLVAYNKGQYGSKNPLLHFLRLVTLFRGLFTQIIMDTFNSYIRLLLTDRRMGRVWAHRCRNSKTDWTTTVERIVFLLSEEIPRDSARSAEDVKGTYLDSWREGFQWLRDDGADQGVEDFLEAYGIFAERNYRLAAKQLDVGRPAVQFDPAMFAAANAALAKYDFRPPLLVGGLTNWQLWTKQLSRRMGIWICQKLSAKNMQSYLRGLVTAKVKEYQGAERISDNQVADLYRELVELGPDAGETPAAAATWANDLLARLGLQTKLQAGSAWLAEYAQKIRQGLVQSRSMDGTLFNTVRSGDDFIWVQETARVFASLGFDASLNVQPKFFEYNAYILGWLVRGSKGTTLAKGMVDFVQRSLALGRSLPAGGLLRSLSEAGAIGWEGGRWQADKRFLAGLDEIFQRAALGLESIAGRDDAPRYRHTLMSLFVSQKYLRSAEIWQGTFLSDGYSIHPLVYNVEKPSFTDAFKNWVRRHENDLRICCPVPPANADAQILSRGGGTACVGDVLLAAAKCDQAFATEQSLRAELPRDRIGRTWDLAAAARCKPKIKLRDVRPARIWGVWEKLNWRPPPDSRDKRKESYVPAILRPIKGYRDSAVKQTAKGLPKSWKAATTASAHTIRAEISGAILKLHPQLPAEQLANVTQHAVVVGCDPGETNPLAFAGNDRRTNASFTMYNHFAELENLRKDRQRDRAKHRDTFIRGLGEGHAALPANGDAFDMETRRSKERADGMVILAGSPMLDLDLRHSPAAGRIKTKYDHRQDAYTQKMALQLVTVVYPQAHGMDKVAGEGMPAICKLSVPPANASTQPLVLFVGDSCDIVKEKFPSHVDQSHRLLREMVHHIHQRGYPILCYTVNESYTSQVCPMPDCVRAGVEEWRDADVGDDNRVRCSLHKPTFGETLNLCQRVQQCELCNRMWNRDSGAGFCIAQAGEATVIGGGPIWSEEA